jgi:hypothetical protein
MWTWTELLCNDVAMINQSRMWVLVLPCMAEEHRDCGFSMPRPHKILHVHVYCYECD